MRLPVHFVRALGYVVITIITIGIFTDSQSIFFPIWAFCGLWLMSYKKKEFPFSRTERIVSNVFEAVFLALLTLQLVLLIIEFRAIRAK